MRKEQLQILRKHGEIFALPDALPDGIKLGPLRFHIENEIYLVAYRVFEIFNNIIKTYFLKPEFKEPGIFATSIKNKIHLYSPIKEDQIKLISQKIIERNEELEIMVTEKLGYPLMPGTIEDLIEYWYSLLTEQEILKNVEYLKFNILKGKKIESFKQKDEWLISIHLFKFEKIPLLREAAYLYTIIDYLKGLIEEKTDDNDSNGLQKKIEKRKLKMNQIALIHFYEGMPITESNGNKIAEGYGHTSGRKLYLEYSYFSKTSNRTERPTPCTPRKFKNKIELFESVIKHLKNGKERANDDLNTLKSKYEIEYV